VESSVNFGENDYDPPFVDATVYAERGNWPKWEERMDRLSEGIRLIKQMWKSKEPFKFEGRFFSSDFYCLYTNPGRKIPIYSSAIGKMPLV